MKLQAPSSKLQTPEKPENPNTKHPAIARFWDLGFENSLELGAWSFQSL
jgi:hypothetical protein